MEEKLEDCWTRETATFVQMSGCCFAAASLHYSRLAFATDSLVLQLRCRNPRCFPWLSLCCRAALGEATRRQTVGACVAVKEVEAGAAAVGGAAEAAGLGPVALEIDVVQEVVLTWRRKEEEEDE